MTVRKEDLSERLQNHLSGFLRLGNVKFAREDDFLDAAVDTILPLYQLASASNSTGSAGLLLSATINAGSLMAKEGKLWLDRIYRRLGGPCSIRRPYYAEVVRDIPHEIFSLVVRRFRNTDGFVKPFFSFHKNVRVEVVSLLCVRLAKEFFAVVSGLPDEEVVTYFRRTLSGLKTGHKVFLIVNDEKQLLLKYNFRSGHLNLCFHYGEWDKLGNPQHHYSVICCRTLTWQQCASLVRVW